MTRKIKMFSGWMVCDNYGEQNTQTIFTLDRFRQEYFKSKGIDYCLIKDELFKFLPDWESLITKTCKIATLTCVSRLLWIKKYLDEGYESVGWIDADVLPYKKLDIDFDHDLICTSCKGFKYNNSIIIFRNTTRSLKILNEYINYAMITLYSKTPIKKWYCLGPEYLTNRSFKCTECYKVITGGVHYNIRLHNDKTIDWFDPSINYINFSPTMNGKYFPKMVKTVTSILYK